jgi:hypothetical protein
MGFTSRMGLSPLCSTVLLLLGFFIIISLLLLLGFFILTVCIQFSDKYTPIGFLHNHILTTTTIGCFILTVCIPFSVKYTSIGNITFALFLPQTCAAKHVGERQGFRWLHAHNRYPLSSTIGIGQRYVAPTVSTLQ